MARMLARLSEAKEFVDFLPGISKAPVGQPSAFLEHRSQFRETERAGVFGWPSPWKSAMWTASTPIP